MHDRFHLPPPPEIRFIPPSGIIGEFQQLPCVRSSLCVEKKETEAEMSDSGQTRVGFINPQTIWIRGGDTRSPLLIQYALTSPPIRMPKISAKNVQFHPPAPQGDLDPDSATRQKEKFVCRGGRIHNPFTQQIRLPCSPFLVGCTHTRVALQSQCARLTYIRKTHLDTISCVFVGQQTDVRHRPMVSPTLRSYPW